MCWDNNSLIIEIIINDKKKKKCKEKGDNTERGIKPKTDNWCITQSIYFMCKVVEN